MGGPFGAVVGAALGHAADSGAMGHIHLPFGAEPRVLTWSPARVAELLGRKDQLFAITAVVLSAKLAKCDGPVSRAEIDAFKRHFHIPPESVRDIGRLFDQARDSTDGFETYADQLGEVFADNRGMLEDVLAALFAVARADGPLNQQEYGFLSRVHHGFRLDQFAWDRAACRRSSSRAPATRWRGSMPRGTRSSASGACDARDPRSAQPQPRRPAGGHAGRHADPALHRHADRQGSGRAAARSGGEGLGALRGRRG